MKIRTGLVSNSSASSFVLDMSKLNASQLLSIQEHKTVGEQLGMSYTDDPWSVKTIGDCLFLDTYMDNFDMHDFLEKIGATSAIIKTWHS